MMERAVLFARWAALVLTHPRLVITVCAFLALWLLWGWSQNGRYTVQRMSGRLAVVCDTRTGEVTRTYVRTGVPQEVSRPAPVDARAGSVAEPMAEKPLTPDSFIEAVNAPERRAVPESLKAK